ncbi:MAG: CRISPR-associated helicase Cas3' [Exilispira sp.]
MLSGEPKVIFYAKSNGENLEEHTKKVCEAFEKLKKFLNYNESEIFLIEKLIYYHDQGKKNPTFQNKMRELLNINERFNGDFYDIPHEWISPAFITEKEENYIKSLLQECGLDTEVFFNFFIFLILSHHCRNNQIPVDENIRKTINWIKSNFFQNAEYYYNVQNLLNIYNTSENRDLWNRFFHYRIRWLGALMKCDYAASAGINPETSYCGDYQKNFNRFLRSKGFELKDFQIKASENSNKSIILIASTGMGKTEAAMNWINGQKAFYLLGIRIAVNEMYKRFFNIFGENVALLHGETSYFFAQEETDENEYETKIEKSRKLSYPLTVATADQLIISVFKYPGFEFTYLTCSYSKIVLDEIQNFSPSAIAAIVVFLKEIHKLGGRFMLMTATLPPFIIEEFQQLNDLTILEPQLLDIKRHKIIAIDEDITSQKILELSNNNRDKKILIICNTIRKAQEIYELFCQNRYSPNLIHSHFIGKDRKEKEAQIMSTKAPCVWISTQIVEASLDIDFDLLLTENSSIESLLQRFGRCYRKREYNGNAPNIYIFNSEPYNIYDKYIFNKTWEVIKAYNNKLISEKDKQDMIFKIFKDIEKTGYYNEYKRQKDLLEIGYRSLTRIEAQEDFRQITNNYIVIPENVYNENIQNISELLNFIDNRENNRLERIKKQSELLDYAIPIQFYGNNNSLSVIDSKFCEKHKIMILKCCEYSQEKGLIKNTQGENTDNII